MRRALETIGIIINLIAVALGLWIVMHPIFALALRALAFLGTMAAAFNAWNIWRCRDRGSAIAFGVSKDRTIKRNVDET